MKYHLHNPQLLIWIAYGMIGHIIETKRGHPRSSILAGIFGINLMEAVTCPHGNPRQSKAILRTGPRNKGSPLGQALLFLSSGKQHWKQNHHILQAQEGEQVPVDQDCV